MRYNTPIYFQLNRKPDYDVTSGDYIEVAPDEEKCFANVTDSGVETLNLVYGGLKQGSLTIRLQRPYKRPFNTIRVGDKQYRVDFSRNQQAFIVSEV